MVLEHDSTLGLDGKCVGHGLMLVAYVFCMLVVCLFFFHLNCVGHGGSGVDMEVLVMLFSLMYD